jgi:hypothetical protein
VVHWPCTVSAVGQTNAANLESPFASAEAIVAWCIGPCTVGAVGQTNATNLEWRFAFAQAIIAWCIGPASSVQLGKQMPRILNGVLIC